MPKNAISVATRLVLVTSLMVGGAPARADDASVQELASRVAELEKEVSKQKDIEAVRRLQYAYNYYNSSGLHKQAMDLVSENAESVEIGGQGVYLGKEGFIRLFGQYSNSLPSDKETEFGRVLFQLVGMDVITIAEDGLTATARVAVLTPIFRGFPGEVRPRLNGGYYEMGYVKEEGVWKISKFKYVHRFNAMLDDNGNIVPGYSTYPTDKADLPTTWYHPWPETGVLPFSFPNPVTGEYPGDHVGDRRYWIGNWPGEFGQRGTRDVSPELDASSGD